jgi:TPR repeat protein
MSRRPNGWQRLWSFGAVALLAAVTVPAQTFDDALAAYRRGEFFVAADAFTKLAEQGDAKAQFNLGLMYYKGEGVRQDKFEAARFFRKAAEQGNAEAQANLGILYYNGDGVQQDKVEAARWLRKAAEQGDAEAQSTLRQLARGQTPGGPKPRRAQSGVPDQDLGDHRSTQGVRGPSALTVFGGLLLFTLIGYLVKFYREHPRMK